MTSRPLPIPVMKKKSFFPLLLLLLIVLAANLGYSKGRRLLVTDQEGRGGGGSSTWEEQNRENQKVGKEGVNEDKASLNNHHNIPREDWDNQPGPIDGQFQPQDESPSDDNLT